MTTFSEKCCPRARIQIGVVESFDEIKEALASGFTLQCTPIYASSEIEIERAVPKNLSGQARDKWISSRKAELKKEGERISAEKSIQAVIAKFSLNGAVDVNNFKEDLGWTRTHFETRQAVALRRRVKIRLTSVRDSSKKLARVLADSEIRTVLETVLAGRIVIDDFRKKLDALANAAILPAIVGPSLIIEEGLASELDIGRSSAFAWLVGKQLPKLFKKHFEQSAGFSRNPRTGKITGPYIGFAKSVLDLLCIDNHGKPYSAASIARALTTAKSAASHRVMESGKRQKSRK